MIFDFFHPFRHKLLVDHSDNKELTFLLIFLGLLGVVLVATTIRGAFIIDEINYMVTVTGLEKGTLVVPYTDGLTPSSELLYFDPEPYGRSVKASPVTSLAPPLYAPLALPFVLLGWRGLALLNTLSFLLASCLIYLVVRRYAKEASTPWMAVGFFILGGYSLEYAQGVWPHMLSVFLCVASVYCICLLWERNGLPYAFLSGALIGLASGVREQNAFLAGCIGLAIFLGSDRRFRSIATYGAGLAIPLLASSVFNYIRHGIFFPVPKSFAYAQLASQPVQSGSWLQPLEVFLVKVIDFSSFAWFQNPNEFVDYAREHSTGAFLVGGIVKKALLQSSPWILLAIVMCILVWKKTPTRVDTRAKVLRTASFIILSTLVMFSLAGFRMDGLAFNQRYLLEIIPFAAIVVALVLDGSAISIPRIISGFLVGAGCFALLLATMSIQIQHVAILRVPLLAGVLVVLFWFLRQSSPWKFAFEVSLGACIGWAMMVQLVDLSTSRQIRGRNATGLESLESVIPDHSALFASWGNQKATAGPLQLKKDVVILDVWADNGKDAGALARQLAEQGRKVFLYGSGMPEEVVADIRGPDSLLVVLSKPFEILEVVARDRHGTKP